MADIVIGRRHPATGRAAYRSVMTEPPSREVAGPAQGTRPIAVPDRAPMDVPR